MLAVDGSPAHHTIATYTIGRLGAMSMPHRDALLHRGLRPAHLRRLLCDVVLTTVLLHKRHAVPVPPLADHFFPLKRGPVNQSLAGRPPRAWYHVANWAPTPRSSRWPAWDVFLGLWLSRDLLLAPKVKTTNSTRNKCSPYRVVYVYIESNQIPRDIQQDIDLEAHDVIVLDNLGRHGLTPLLPDRRCLWAIHYGGNGRSLEELPWRCDPLVVCRPAFGVLSHPYFTVPRPPHGLQGHAGGHGSARPVAMPPPVTRPRTPAPGSSRYSAQSCRTALLARRRPKSGVMPRRPTPSQLTLILER